MGGTSERKPPGRERAHRHLHAVPQQQDQDPGADAGAGSDLDHDAGPQAGARNEQKRGAGPQAGAGSEHDQDAGRDTAAGNASAAGPEPFPPPPPSTSPPAGRPSTETARPAAGRSPAPNGASPPAAGPPAAPAGGAHPLLMPPGRHILAATGFYLVLLVLGVLLGLTGAFQFSRGIGPVPVGAVLFVLAVGAVCWLCGRATRSVGGALVPAVGWIVASFSMAMPNTSGSVVITNSIAGEIYLYGGALCAAIGVGAAFGGWTRAQQASISSAGAGPRRPRP